MIKDKILAAKIAIDNVLNSTDVPKHEVYEALEELEAEIQSCLESLEDDTVPFQKDLQIFTLPSSSPSSLSSLLISIIWEPNPDGEYNEQSAVINENKVVIYSDRDEEVWMMVINDEEPWELEASNVHDARREAIKEAIDS